MFGGLKLKRIDKLTDTHAEEISDRLILMRIVDQKEAERNLTDEDWERFRSLYEQIEARNYELCCNRTQYLDSTQDEVEQRFNDIDKSFLQGGWDT